MRKLTRGRPLNRKQRRAFEQFRATSLVLLRLAETSLELSEKEIANAQDGHNETADMLQARVFELLELVHGVSDPATEQARAEIEARRGQGFLARVAAMGRPAAEALAELQPEQLELQRRAPVLLRAAMGVLFAFVMMLWPSAAKASERVVSCLRAAHKIHRRNSAGLLALVRKITDHFARRGWIQSKKYYAISARRSQSCRVSATGYACGRVSSGRRARPSRSSWCGGSVAFASGVCPTPSPTSRLNVPTARSSARRTASQAKGAANASA